MFKTLTFPASLSILSIFLSSTSFADNFQIGDSSSDLGAIIVSGWLRANYQDKSYASNDKKLKFDAAKINLDYNAKYFFGNIEYRCYQFDKICDFSSIVNANLGYKINQNQSIRLGIQDIPFGPSRSWSTSWYGGVLVNTGLEDVHNLGINYHYQYTDNGKLDIGYFLRDAGNYTGKSLDSAHYSANFIKSSSINSPSVKEKNMWVTRIDQKLPLSNIPNLDISLGASYWYSDLENHNNGNIGHRNTWAAFSRLNYNGIHFTLTGGKNRVNNQDSLYPDYTLVGSFDTPYYVANRGNFYTADVNYTFKNIFKHYNLTPYASYTIYDKNNNDAQSSKRNILGMQLDINQFSVATEYIIGKNDTFIGGNEYSWATGTSNKSEHLLNILFLYNF